MPCFIFPVEKLRCGIGAELNLVIFLVFFWSYLDEIVLAVGAVLHVEALVEIGRDSVAGSDADLPFAFCIRSVSRRIVGTRHNARQAVENAAAAGRERVDRNGGAPGAAGNGVGMEMDPKEGGLGPDGIGRLVGATVATQFRRRGQVAVEDLDVVLAAVVRVQLEVVQGDLDLLAALGQVDQPNAVDVDAVVGREIGRRQGLRTRHHTAARRNSERRVETDSGHGSIRLLDDQNWNFSFPSSQFRIKKKNLPGSG